MTAVPRYVALLRAINVGGSGRLPMGDLRRIVASAGCTDVTTYLASGNVVLESPGRSAAEVAAAIEHRLAQDAGLDVAVLLRTPAELDAIVASEAFRGAPDPATLYVTFLAREPDPAMVAAVDPRTSAPEHFEVTGREVLVHCPGGYGRTKLSGAFFERAFGVLTTTRNARTVNALAELARRA